MAPSGSLGVRRLNIIARKIPYKRILKQAIVVGIY